MNAYAATPETMSQLVGDAIDPETAAKLRAMGQAPRTRAPRSTPRSEPRPPKPDDQYSSPASANKAWQRYVTSLTEYNKGRAEKVPMADRDAINGRKPLSPKVDPQESRGVNSVRAQMAKAESTMTPEERATVRSGQAESARRRGGDRREELKKKLPESRVQADTGTKADPYADAPLSTEAQAILDEFEAGLPKTPKTGKLTAGSKKRLSAFRSQLARSRDMNDNAAGLPRSDTPSAPRREAPAAPRPRALQEMAQEARQAQRFKEAGVDLKDARKRRLYRQPGSAGLDGRRTAEVAVDANGKPYVVAGADDLNPGALDPKAGLINKAELDRQKQAIREGKNYESERDARILMDSSHRNRMAGEGERSYAPGESTRPNQPDNNYDLSERGTRLNPKRTPGSRKLRPRRKADRMRAENPGYNPGAVAPTGRLGRDVANDAMEARLRRQELAQRELDDIDRLDQPNPKLGPNGRPFRDEEGDFWGTLDVRHPDFNYWLANRRRAIERGTATPQEVAAYEAAVDAMNKSRGGRKPANSNSAMWGETQSSAKPATPATAKPKAKPKATKPKDEPAAEAPAKPAKSTPKKPAASSADTAATRAKNMEQYRQLEKDGRIPKGSVARFEAGETWNQILADAPKPAKAGKPKAAASEEAPATPTEKPTKPTGKPKASKPEEAPTTSTSAPPPPANELTQAGVKKPKPGKAKGTGEYQARKLIEDRKYTSKVRARAINVRREDRPAAELARRVGGKAMMGGVALATAGGIGMAASRWDRRDAAAAKPAPPATSAPAKDTPPPAEVDAGQGRVFTDKDGNKYRKDKKGRRISLGEFARRESYRRQVSGMGSTDRERFIQQELERRSRYRKGLGAKTFGSRSTTATRNKGVPEGMPLATWRTMSDAEKRRYKQVNR
jgi:hypothetical protein